MSRDSRRADRAAASASCSVLGPYSWLTVSASHVGEMTRVRTSGRIPILYMASAPTFRRADGDTLSPWGLAPAARTQDPACRSAPDTAYCPGRGCGVPTE